MSEVHPNRTPKGDVHTKTTAEMDVSEVLPPNRPPLPSNKSVHTKATVEVDPPAVREERKRNVHTRPTVKFQAQPAATESVKRSVGKDAKAPTAQDLDDVLDLLE